MNRQEIPPPLKLLRPSQSSVRYSLKVVQNPLRARCCGFGQKDRRPIDPPPIVQLCAKNEYGLDINLKPEDSILFLAQCELYDADMKENRTMVVKPSSLSKNTNKKPEIMRNLIGSSVSNAYHLYNDQGKPGTYFVFHDLSVRTEGIFRLKFVFVNLAAGEPLTMSTYVQEEVFSACFTVYPVKKFPGLTESTRLSRCFSKQGIKIPIRSETPSKRSLSLNTSEEASGSNSNDTKEQQVAEGEGRQEEKEEETERTPSFTRLSISDFLLPN